MLCALLSAGACRSGKPGTTGTASGRAPLCGTAANGEIIWFAAGQTIDTTGLGMPSRYGLYRVDTASARQFFSVNRREFSGDPGKPVTFRAAIPMEEGCVNFLVGPSGAVPPELMRKYPNMMSLQGNGVEKRSYDLRLDWDGKVFRGLIQTGGTTILMEPVPATANRNNDLYYIYDRIYTNQQKKPFESTPKVRVDR